MIYAIEFIFRRQYRFEKFNIGGIFVKRITFALIFTVIKSMSSKKVYYSAFYMVSYLRNFDYWKQTQLYFDISRKRRYGYCYIYTLDTEVSCCIEF